MEISNIAGAPLAGSSAIIDAVCVVNWGQHALTQGHAAEAAVFVQEAWRLAMSAKSAPQLRTLLIRP
jgi:hypothetical protein